MSTFGLTRQLSDGSRELNLYYCYCGDCDNGDNDINSGISKFVRLGCKCVLHYVCLIQYLRYKLGDRLTMSLNGIACPFGSECRSFKTLDEVGGDDTLIYYITTDELDNIVAYGINHSKLQEYLDENDCKPLTHEEVNDLRKWIDDEKTREIVPIDPNVITDLFVLSTTKACPHCNFRSSHPHGHQCHHISPANPPKRGGCPNCHINYCYKCLSTEIENKRDRGGALNCRCNYWSNFCNPLTSSYDIKNFISINEGGIPFDKRCGCVICSDCKYNSPCSFCPGDCCVCEGYVNPSPNEYIDINNRGQIKWKADGPKLIADDTSGSSSNNNYSLFDCCRHGYVDELRIILQEPNTTADDVNRRDRNGRTGLHIACDANQIECVQLLLDYKDIVVNMLDNSGQTPLHTACSSDEGYEVVTLLLTHKDVDVNAVDNYGRTPLRIADANDDLANDTFWLLAAHPDVNISIQQCCSLGLSKKLVTMLQKPNTTTTADDVNRRDEHGRTALYFACSVSHLECVRLLLDYKDIAVNVPDKSGMTPLIAACWGSSYHYGNGFRGGTYRSRTEVISLLLNHKDIDVNAADKYGSTLLHHACSRKHTEIITLLLAHEQINTNATDINGFSPLNKHISCSNDIYSSSDEIVSLLLSHKSIDVNRADSKGFSPLNHACTNRLYHIQNLLLAHPGIRFSIRDCCCLGLSDELVGILQQPSTTTTTADEVNSRDINGRTGLHLACYAKHLECFRLLLTHKDTDVNIPDNDGNSPLNLVCCTDFYDGGTEYVRLLLRHKDIAVNLPDSKGRSPLYNACSQYSKGHNTIVALLLTHKDISVNTVGNDGRSPLTLCLSRVYTNDNDFYNDDRCLLLLSHKDINVNVTDENGDTLLNWAVKHRRIEIIIQLLNRTDVDVNIYDWKYRTPLNNACYNGDDSIVLLLLKHKSIDVNIDDRDGRTPLMNACYKDYKDNYRGSLHTQTIKQLLTHKDINIDITDKDGKTALHWAHTSDKKVANLLENNFKRRNKYYQ